MAAGLFAHDLGSGTRIDEIFRDAAIYQSDSLAREAFAIERGVGVTSGLNEEKLGVRGTSTTTVTFDQVRVPATQVLDDVGRGFKVAMEVLTSARLSLASSCLGKGKRLFEPGTRPAASRSSTPRSHPRA